ncbi:MAG: ROK family transcriptional regulator, partial [Litorilinea sp.]
WAWMVVCTMAITGKADQGFIRKRNASLVLNELRLSAPLSRADLAKRIGLNRSTISSIVAQLLEEQLVHETELQTDKIGRPGLSLELNPSGGCMIGVEVGVGISKVILTDFLAGNIWKGRLELPLEEPIDGYLHAAGRLVEHALREAAKQQRRVLGIGISVPGLVDVTEGVLRISPNFRGQEIPIVGPWRKRFGLPVIVENDANAAALGEHYFGVAKDAPNFLYLGAAAGIGGGIIIDGKIFRGRGGYAGEVGHMTMDPEGDMCNCGKRGCWETLIGPRAVVERYRRSVAAGSASPLSKNLEGVTFGAIVEAAEIGDLAAVSVLQEVGHDLGLGIANLVNVFNPQLVILGGVLSLAHETLIPMIRETVKQNSLYPMRAALSILPSEYGTEDCLMGAVSLILDDLMRAPV